MSDDDKNYYEVTQSIEVVWRFPKDSVNNKEEAKDLAVKKTSDFVDLDETLNIDEVKVIDIVDELDVDEPKNS